MKKCRCKAKSFAHPWHESEDECGEELDPESEERLCDKCIEGK